MEAYFLAKGIIMGFSIAAPVGPLGILCIRRTLSDGMLNGFITGLGAATADAVYGCIAAFGLTVVSALLLDNQIVLRLVGGLFLLYLGVLTCKSKPAEIAAKVGEEGALGAYVSAFFLTLANPLTIMSFAAVFAGLGVGETGGNHWLAAVLVLGVFIGSTLWWLILSAMANSFRNRLDHQKLTWVNRLSGLIISTFGIISLLTVIIAIW